MEHRVGCRQPANSPPILDVSRSLKPAPGIDLQSALRDSEARASELDEQLKLLEDGNLSLEAALKAVDDARVYLKICTERLEAARKKIEVRGESGATE